jgi:hypothetical protein
MATTTNYGWETADDTDLVKDGALAMRTLGSAIDTTVKALNPSTTLGDIEYRSSTANTNTRLAIGSTGNVLTVAGGVPTWAAPGGSSGLTLISTDAFSAVSGVIKNSVFSSTYDNYRVVFTATAASALTMTMRLRASGTDNSGSNYTSQFLDVSNTTVSGSRITGGTSWNTVVVRTTLLTPLTFDIFNPFKASPTIAMCDTVDIGDPGIRLNLLTHDQNTSYDGFNMICSTSNMTGSVSIYGYNK